MLVSKSKAAKLAGVSRTTIHRYASEGKLSLTFGQVDTSELMRVFGPLAEQGGTPEQVQSTGHDVTGDVQGVQIGFLEAQVRELKEDRDRWRDKADQITELLRTEQENFRLLTHQAKPSGTGMASMLTTAAGVILAVVALAGLLYLVIGVARL